MAQLALLLIFIVGFANQRGSTCAVSAADEIVREGRFRRIAGFALAAAISAAGMALLGSGPRQTAGAGLMAVCGGILAALGVSLNGRCAMGTLSSLCRGRSDRIGTLAGFFVGAWLLLHLPGLPAPHLAAIARSNAALMAALALGAGIIAWPLARGEGLPTPGWMALIGLLNLVLLAAKPDWTYTSGLTSLARGDSAAPLRLALDLALVVSGGVVAAKLNGDFKARVMAPRTWIRSLGGGLLMGAGSALVPGGNDTMLLIGVPLLLPGLLLAYAAFWIALLALRALAHRSARKESIRAKV